MKIVIRADAGPAIGTGHVMRMMALGQAFVKMDAAVSLLSGVLPVGLTRRLESVGIECFRQQNCASDAADAEETLSFAERENADWIILDGYHFDAAYQQRVASGAAQMMMMDDSNLADESFANLILNQNAYAEKSSHRDGARLDGARLDGARRVNGARRLSGCRYTLLRAEFLSAAACEKKIIRQVARRILVTFGGCDDADWTQRTLKRLGEFGSDRLIVDAVIGAGYQRLDSLLQLKRELPYSIRIHRNVDRMVDLMHRVDFAITAGGSTCYELARCGVPAIAIPVAENQSPVVNSLAELNVVVGFDPAAQTDGDASLGQLIKKTINDFSGRERMSRNGAMLVDGQGAFRIARLMASTGIELRDATIDDAQQLLMWRNDPEVRSVSFASGPIELKNHVAWLERKLDDPDCRIWLAADKNGQPIGQVRLDFDADDCAVISLSIDHARRARGLGKILIERSCELAFAERPQLQSVLAQIKPGNIASERAFRNVGFVPIEPAMIDKKLAFQFMLPREKIVQQRAVA